jgi:hypothetical protein
MANRSCAGRRGIAARSAERTSRWLRPLDWPPSSRSRSLNIACVVGVSCMQAFTHACQLTGNNRSTTASAPVRYMQLAGGTNKSWAGHRHLDRIQLRGRNKTRCEAIRISRIFCPRRSDEPSSLGYAEQVNELRDRLLLIQSDYWLITSKSGVTDKL